MKYNKYKEISFTRGVTLVELLLYVSVTVVLLSAISASLAMMLQSRVKNQTIAEVEQQGVQVMQIIAQTLRNAEGITSPSIGNNATSLTLDVVGTTSDPVVFDLSGGVLRIAEGVGPVIPLTNSHVEVSGLVFNNVSYADTPGIMQVVFTITHVNLLGRNEYEFSKTFQTSTSLRYPQ